jgi:hypothetical protein
MRVFVSDHDLTIVDSRDDFMLVATRNNPRLRLFRRAKKLYFDIALKDWRGRMGKSFSSYWTFRYAAASTKQLPSEKISGVLARVEEIQPLDSIDKSRILPGISIKSFKVWILPSPNTPPQFFAVLSRLYNLPVCDGIPLRAVNHTVNNNLRSDLQTWSISNTSPYVRNLAEERTFLRAKSEEELLFNVSDWPEFQR